MNQNEYVTIASIAIYDKRNMPKMPVAPAVTGVVVVSIIKRSPVETRPANKSILLSIFFSIPILGVRVTNRNGLVTTTAAKN